MQYQLHMSDGESVLISSEDFGKVNEAKVALCPVIRRDAKTSSEATVWVNPSHVVRVTRRG